MLDHVVKSWELILFHVLKPQRRDAWDCLDICWLYCRLKGWEGGQGCRRASSKSRFSAGRAGSEVDVVSLGWQDNFEGAAACT